MSDERQLLRAAVTLRAVGRPPSEPLAALYELLDAVVLLPVERAKKSPIDAGWEQVTYQDTISPEYRRRLEDRFRFGGNVGVRLGPLSGRLLALDLDDDALIDPWLARVPWLANTLRTKGKRGCQFWMRLEEGCEYPNGKAIYPLKGVGELRLGGASGAQSVIWGVHPDGMQYKILVCKPVLEVDLSDLDEIAPGLLFPEPTHLVAPAFLGPFSTNGAQPTNIMDRVRSYLDACPPAVAGQNGGDKTFGVMCHLIRGFDLNPDQAWTAANYYNVKCEPPWNEKELRHKVGDALQATANESRGQLLVATNAPRLARELREEQATQVTPAQTAGQRNEEPRPGADGQGGIAVVETPLETNKSEHSKKSQLILPSSYVSITESASNLFTQLAKTRRYFARGRLVVEVVCNKEGNEILSPLRASAFRSRMEKEFKLLAWRLRKEEPVLKPMHCPKDIAEAFLESDPAIDCLPGISLLVSSPILAERDGEIVALNKGYHDINGGIYIERRIQIEELPLAKAVENLLGLLADFDFTTGSDKARAIASFISPALRFGRVLDADFPLDLAEADESQSGKTYRQRIACAIYGKKPYVIARRENGVGSLDESISCALLSERPFICFENVRGIMDSQILESAIRGHGHVNVRVPHRGEVQLSTERVCWQLSSNQAATTRDLANRSVVTRIRKRPSDYQYRAFPEGDLLTHVQRNCGYYLSSVFSVVQAWFKKGRPKTTDSSHDFREWSQSLDWIVQNIFSLPPLLNGHREEQQRISDPHLNWLRDISVAVKQAQRFDEGLRVGELVDLAASRGVAAPGHGRHADDDQLRMLAGRILNKIFSDSDIVNVGGFKVRHDLRKEYDAERRREVPRHYYWFEILPENCASCAPCASN
jgi:hypothetical protein